MIGLSKEETNYTIVGSFKGVKPFNPINEHSFANCFTKT